jgi:broad specificity phosphatase PhoE
MSIATPPAGEIVLVRHGRSAHVERGWLDAAGLRRWMAAYDAAALAPDSSPPPALLDLARSVDRIVTSDLPRAVASAALLAGSRDIEATPLLREAPLETPDCPLPRLAGVRLPLSGWALVFGIRWLRARRRGAPPPGVDTAVLARAESAVTWLTDEAPAGMRVLVVTHGTLRTLLAAALMRRGWQPPVRRPFREWSAWRFQAPTAGLGVDVQLRPGGAHGGT